MDGDEKGEEAQHLAHEHEAGLKERMIEGQHISDAVLGLQKVGPPVGVRKGHFII